MLGLECTTPCLYLLIYLRFLERILPIATYLYGRSLPSPACSKPDLVRIDWHVVRSTLADTFLLGS